MAEGKRGPGRPPGSKNKNSSTANKASQTKNQKNAQKSASSNEDKIKRMQAARSQENRTIDIIWGVSLMAIGVFFFFTVLLDNTGAFGRAIHDVMLGLFGIMAYVLPFFFALYGVLLFTKKLQHFGGRTVFFTFCIYISMCLLNAYRFIDPKKLGFGISDISKYYTAGVKGELGGAVGMELGNLLVKGFGKPGLMIFAISLIIISILFVANTPISKWVTKALEKRETRRLVRELEEAEQKKRLKEVHDATLSEIASDSFYQDYQNHNQNFDIDLYKDKNIEKKEENLFRDSKLSTMSQADSELEREKATEKRRSIFSNFFKENPSVGKEDDEKAKAFAKTLNSGVKEEQEDLKVEPAAIAVEPEIIAEPSSVTQKKHYGLAESIDQSGFGLGLSNDVFSVGGNIIDTSPVREDFSMGVAGKVSTVSSTATGIDSAAVAGASTLAAAKVANSFSSNSFIDDQDASQIPDRELSDLRKEIDSRKAAKKNIEPIDTSDVANDINAGLSENSTHELYKLPPYDLLRKARGGSQVMTDYQLKQRGELLRKTLNDFGVDATILSVTQGASVTRYEVQPATGVKVSKITGLADDIALNLRAKSIRMEAPIPGKAAVGIEVENDKPSPVLIRDMIESKEFISSDSKLSFVVGKDISSNIIVADLKEMPHMLIAGATGSGKSVCINSIIASILYKAKPNEVKLIMIDPKVVELGNYNGIPHLLTSVVTDPRKASRALGEAVAEMNKRYEEFAKLGVKDLSSYNEFMIANQEPQNCKPQIVIIIDELADLMMAAPSSVEESICRLAQKARAAGMHLIVATQRPSVDVVTGLIKANIPSRIAFSVASSIDSRTILDMAGAEKLLGKGDMLFSPVGSTKPIRVQGPYISDTETNKIIEFWKNQGQPDYDEKLSNAIEQGESSSNAPEDELTEDAIAFILKSKQASVSMLQRRFRIGYNRAARIIDEIESKGIIGPSDGSRPRPVLVTEEDYYNNDDSNIDDDLEKSGDAKNDEQKDLY